MSPTLQALPLRPYQRQALDAVKAKIAEGIHRIPVVLPTGAGKTVCFAHEALEWIAEHPEDRVVVLVHTDELVGQAYDKILKVAPHLRVGIVKAQRRDYHADVIVASVQSLRSAAERRKLRGVGLVIVDECHHATARTYMDILTDLGCFGGNCIAVGYTATLVRGDGKSLYPTWQEVAFSRDISWMVRKGYLIPPRGLAVEVPDLDLRSVKASRTDFREGELGEALAESLAPELVAAAYLEHAGKRRGLLFAPTVAAAEVFAGALDEAGVSASVIHGGMPLEQRRDILARHRAGLFQVLCNCMVLTEGYDDPSVECVVVARPTKSRGLYIQMVGRGLRVDPERDYAEQDCLILDVVGANTVHDLRTVIDLSERKLKAEDAHSGKTLIELEDDLWDGGGVPEDEAPVYRGEVVSREFDPMGRPSTKVWLRTKDGTYFVPAGKHAYVFVLQYGGGWSVAWCGAKRADRFEVIDGTPHYRANLFTNAGRDVGMTGHRGLPLDQALVWAEDLALELGASTGLATANKAAPWRKKVPSEGMKGLATNLGLTIQDGERAGALSDRITEVMGSRRIDPLVRKVQGRAV